MKYSEGIRKRNTGSGEVDWKSNIGKEKLFP